MAATNRKRLSLLSGCDSSSNSSSRSSSKSDTCLSIITCHDITEVCYIKLMYEGAGGMMIIHHVCIMIIIIIIIIIYPISLPIIIIIL